MKNEKVSIIVPIYNVQEYLTECIDSLVKQTYQNIEIILVDDGSTDSCLKICEKYHNKDNRVQVYHKSNGGISTARNLGLDVAEGEYIFFVDGDDYIELTTIEILVKFARCYEADIAMILKKDSPYLEDKIMISDGIEMLIHILKISSFEAWGKLFRKELFSGVRFPEGKIFEDMYIIPIIFSKAKNNVLYHEGLYIYRIRENSIMHRYRKKASPEICNYVEYGFNYVKKMKINDRSRLELNCWYLRHLLWYFYNRCCAYPEIDNKLYIKGMSKIYKKEMALYIFNDIIKFNEKLKYLLLAICPYILIKYEYLKAKKFLRTEEK